MCLQWCKLFRGVGAGVTATRRDFVGIMVFILLYFPSLEQPALRSLICMQEAQRSIHKSSKPASQVMQQLEIFTSDHRWLESWSCRFKLGEEFYMFTNQTGVWARMGIMFHIQNTTSLSWIYVFFLISLCSTPLSHLRKICWINDSFCYFWSHIYWEGNSSVRHWIHLERS